VKHHLESFLAEAEETDPLGFGVSSWVERDFRAYLRCGILAHGFATTLCVVPHAAATAARSGWCRSPARPEGLPVL